MRKPWPWASLGEVLHHRKEFITIDDLATYRRPRVQLHAQGVVLRDEISGGQIKTKQQQVCRAGDFLVAEIDAKVGGFGLVPPELDGAIVSSHYFLFDVDQSKLDRSFLGWFCQTPLFRDQVTAQGSTNYAAIRPANVLGYRLPLPSLVEQQRVLKRIGAVAAELEGRTHAVRHTEADLNALLRSMIANDPDLTPTPMRNLVKLRHLDVQVQPTGTYQFAGVYSFGRGVFRAQQKLGADFAYTRLTTLRAGDFTYPKLMAWEGAFGIVPPACEGCVVSPEFPVFEVDRCSVLPEVLDIHFRDSSVWPVLAGTSTGTNARRRRLNPESLLAYPFPLPSFRTQERVGQIFEEVAALRRIRAEADAEAVQLLPTLLMETFSGGAPLAAERSFVTH